VGISAPVRKISAKGASISERHQANVLCAEAWMRSVLEVRAARRAPRARIAEAQRRLGMPGEVVF
jgi:hypothetical protein